MGQSRCRFQAACNLGALGARRRGVFLLGHHAQNRRQPQSAQFEIDHDYQLSFAQAAARNGVGTLVLVSAAQANADSRFFYIRMKGQLENAVRALPFAKTVILRPPMLVRDHSDRPSEILTVKLLRGLNAIGLFRSQKPMPTDTLARAMCHAAAEFPEGVHILEAADIWQAAP